MTIMPFNYRDTQVRVVAINSEPWFVAADVASVLGLTNIHSSLALLDEDERGIHTMDTPSGAQQMATISEAGLYSLILRSRKPEAKAFKRWVTHEVLPQIRRTGRYGTPALTDDQIVHQALQITARRIEALEAELAVALPKADTWDAICSGVGDYTITDAAKVLARAGIKTGPRILHNQLLTLGWIYKNQKDKWAAKQVRLNDGCLAERVRFYIDDMGVSQLASPQVRVTAKGLDRLRDLLAEVNANEEVAA